jgi:hypothetical protein
LLYHGNVAASCGEIVDDLPKFAATRRLLSPKAGDAPQLKQEIPLVNRQFASKFTFQVIRDEIESS